jgi:hypothetical protein
MEHGLPLTYSLTATRIRPHRHTLLSPALPTYLPSRAQLSLHYRIPPTAHHIHFHLHRQSPHIATHHQIHSYHITTAKLNRPPHPTSSLPRASYLPADPQTTRTTYGHGHVCCSFSDLPDSLGASLRFANVFSFGVPSPLELCSLWRVLWIFDLDP